MFPWEWAQALVETFPRVACGQVLAQVTPEPAAEPSRPLPSSCACSCAARPASAMSSASLSGPRSQSPGAGPGLDWQRPPARWLLCLGHKTEWPVQEAHRTKPFPVDSRLTEPNWRPVTRGSCSHPPSWAAGPAGPGWDPPVRLLPWLAPLSGLCPTRCLSWNGAGLQCAAHSAPGAQVWGIWKGVPQSMAFQFAGPASLG